MIDYYGCKSIPINRVDTHSLCRGGPNALHLLGYSNTQIQKVKRLRSKTFKEYIYEQLLIFSEDVSKDMQQKFEFVNVEGGCATLSHV